MMGAPGRCNTDRDRLRAGAHQLVQKAIKAGDIPPPTTLTCADCGEPGYCYDHRDYRQPMLIEPVCRACNNRRGPGLPLPTKADNAEYKLNRSSKTSGWGHLDGGEGYDPLQSNLSTEIDFCAIEVMADNAKDFHSVIKHVQMKARAQSGNNPGQARADWFKARDPWCV